MKINVLDPEIDGDKQFIVAAKELSAMWFRAYCIGEVRAKGQIDKDSEIEVEEA